MSSISTCCTLKRIRETTDMFETMEKHSMNSPHPSSWTMHPTNEDINNNVYENLSNFNASVASQPYSANTEVSADGAKRRNTSAFSKSEWTLKRLLDGAKEYYTSNLMNTDTSDDLDIKENELMSTDSILSNQSSISSWLQNGSLTVMEA